MKRTHRALSAALAVVLASSLCTIPAYAVESDAEPAPPGRVQADETAPNQSPEADHGPGNEVPDASGTAEASGSKSQTRTENATEPTASPLQAENASRSAVAPPAGELRVTLTEGRPAATAGTAYEVALADSDGVQVGAQQLNLSLEGDSWSVARFDGLADGSYTLSVRAPGIAPYSQKIDVKGDSSAVELYVGDLAADPQAPARIGVLVPGDVNGDGTVDDADASAIIDDIEAGAAGPPPAIINRLGGSLLAGGFLALVNLLSRGGVGWGDVKLFAASGLLIGAAPAITALLMGYVAAGLWYAVPLVRGRVGRKTQIPMAPFFAVSLMVCGLWFRQLFLWYLGFFR